MGSSFTGYRGTGFWSRDDSIRLWLYLLAQEVGQLPDAPEWLGAAAADWQQQATSAASGCVSARLDEHVPTPDRVVLLLRHAERTLVRLRDRGDVLSAAWLNSLALGSRPKTLKRDLPNGMFTRTGEDFIRLLRGESPMCVFNRGTLLTPLAVAIALIAFVIWQGDWLGLVGLPLIYLSWCACAPNLNCVDGCLPVLATGLCLAIGIAIGSNGMLIVALCSGVTWLVASLEAAWRSKPVPIELLQARP